MQRLQVLAVCHHTHVILRDDTYSSAINLLYLKSQYGKAEKKGNSFNQNNSFTF